MVLFTLLYPQRRLEDNYGNRAVEYEYEGVKMSYINHVIGGTDAL